VVTSILSFGIEAKAAIIAKRLAEG